MPKSGRRHYTSAHRRLREVMIAQVEWGVTACCICRHPLELGDRVQLDHDDQGGDTDYRGLAHSSPCRICGKRCNQRAGGVLAAQLAGKRLRERQCVICGMPFTASRGTDGAQAATCGRAECVTQLRRVRKARQPDPAPPPATGRQW